MPRRIHGCVGRVEGWEIRLLAHTSPLFRVFQVIFRQYIPQRAGEGRGLPNHCLFPLVVLDSFSTFFLSPHLSPPSICLYFSLFLFPALTTYDSRQATALSHPPTHRVLIPSYHPAVRDPSLLSPALRTCARTVYVHIGARHRVCVRI